MDQIKKLICCVCGKKFFHKLQDDSKLSQNDAFCSEFCWHNNSLTHE